MSPSRRPARVFVWWTRERVVSALRAFAAEHGGDAAVASSPAWDALIARLPGAAGGSGRRGRYPGSGVIMRHFRSLREAWRAAGVPMDRWREAWTPEEQAFVRRWWGLEPDAWLAEQLGRTEAAVQMEAIRLGVKNRTANARRQGALTPRDMARLFGVDPTTPVRSWAQRYGWLPVTKSPIKAGPEGTAWLFCRDCVARFIRTHGWAYDWRRMQPGHPLTELAREVNARDPWLTADELMAEIGKSWAFVLLWTGRGLLPHKRRPSRAGAQGGTMFFRRRDLPAALARIAEETARNRAEGNRRRHLPPLRRDERGVYWLPDRSRGFVSREFARQQLAAWRAAQAQGAQQAQQQGVVA